MAETRLFLISIMTGLGLGLGFWAPVFFYFLANGMKPTDSKLGCKQEPND